MNEPLATVGALVDPTVYRGEVDVKPADDDKRFFSVTTILGALDKPALVYWSAKETAKAAIRIANSLPARIAEDGEDAVIKMLADARYATPKGQRTASDLGTAVHAAIEQYSLSGIYPDVDEEVRPFLEQFDRWAQLWQPVYLAAEAAVYSPTQGYAGTLDAIVSIDGEDVILDYKTTRKNDADPKKRPGPYPEAALQLAAYRHAELIATFSARRFEKFKRRYYLLNEIERESAVPMPKVTGAVVLHITPDHADLYPVKTDESIYEAFLYVIEAFRWTSHTSKSVIGDRLIKGE